MTVMEQCKTAEDIRVFLSKWGLKQKFVAKTCGIPETAFSRFVTGKLALSDKQIARVVAYMNDYEKRNG